MSDKGINFTKLHSKEKNKTKFVKKCLFDSGLWTSFLTRPYSKVPSAESVPSSIFVTAMDTEPLSPEAELIINNNSEAFNEGLKNISVLTEGKTFVCTREK